MLPPPNNLMDPPQGEQVIVEQVAKVRIQILSVRAKLETPSKNQDNQALSIQLQKLRQRLASLQRQLPPLRLEETNETNNL